jgi:hypothetical protein
VRIELNDITAMCKQEMRSTYFTYYTYCTCSSADRGTECRIPYDDCAVSCTDNGWVKDVVRGRERGRTDEEEGVGESD